jgi:hypothetical protein
MARVAALRLANETGGRFSRSRDEQGRSILRLAGTGVGRCRDLTQARAGVGGRKKCVHELQDRPRSAVSRARRAAPTGGRRRSIRAGGAIGIGGTPHICRNCLGSSGLLGMGHVPVENETITFVAALRHNEMMAPRVFEGRGHEPGLHRALLGSEAPGAVTSSVKLGGERRVRARLSIRFASSVGRQMTRPSPPKNGRSRLIGRPSK